MPEVSFWRRNTSSVFHNLQLAPKITRTESGFPERGKQQNIAHGICPIVCSRSQSVNGTFPSNGKHRALDNTLSRNRPTCSLVSLSSFGFHTNWKTNVVVDFITKINLQGEKGLFSLCSTEFWLNYSSNVLSDNLVMAEMQLYASVPLWHFWGQITWLQDLSQMGGITACIVYKFVRVRQTGQISKPVKLPFTTERSCEVTSNLFQQQTALSGCLWPSLVGPARLSSHTGPAIHLGNLSTLFPGPSNKCQGPPQPVYLQNCCFLFRHIKTAFLLRYWP